MAPALTAAQIVQLTKVLANTKDMSQLVGGVVGADLVSCVKSIEHLLKCFMFDWDSVWLGGPSVSAQQKRTKMVCNNIRDMANLLNDLIDHKTGSTQGNFSGQQIDKVPKLSFNTTGALLPPQSLPTLIPSVVVSFPSKRVVDGAGGTSTSPSPASSQSSSQSSTSSQNMIPYQVRRTPTAGTQLLVVEKPKYYQLQDRYNQAARKIQQLEEQFKTASKATKLNAKTVGELQKALVQTTREKEQVKMKADEAVKLIGELSRRISIENLPEWLKTLIRRVIIEECLPKTNLTTVRRANDAVRDAPPAVNGLGLLAAAAAARPRTTIQKAELFRSRGGRQIFVPVGDGGTRIHQDGSKHIILKSLQLPVLQLAARVAANPPPLGRLVCFVCGVVATDPGSILTDPGTMRDYCARLNASQLAQLRAAADVGGKGAAAVVCKSHSVEEWMERLLKYQPLIARKRSHEEMDDMPRIVKKDNMRDMSITVEDEVSRLTEAGKRSKEESTEEKVVKMEDIEDE